ncbi:FixH family protein [Zooshikella harenae]|uniref:FixH family protein n=1 Tax=Zooshikella harenae TaxID=2827238 RepID=A0ABS5Z700_9GAMM|nr:FixH family protein [Zooshikella harenae]MBU2709819.1 FixH family protein [Zooshikella harenae]
MAQNHPLSSEDKKHGRFWLGFLLAIPILAIILGSSYIAIAVRNADSLVVDDYYKEGLAIEKELKRDRHAQALGLTAKVYLDNAQKRVRITLSPDQDNMPRALTLSFISPTLPEEDATLPVQLNIDNEYEGFLPHEITGKRYIHLETPKAVDKQKHREGWRLIGGSYIDTTSITIALQPATMKIANE